MELSRYVCSSLMPSSFFFSFLKVDAISALYLFSGFSPFSITFQMYLLVLGDFLNQLFKTLYDDIVSRLADLKIFDFSKYFLTCSFPTKGRCVCLFIRTNYTLYLVAADFHTFLEQCLNSFSYQVLSGSIFSPPFLLSVNNF